MFSHWDDNGDGAISYPEFVAVMKVVTERQGRPYSEKKVQAMFGLADLDRNGVVDFEEFVVMQADDDDHPSPPWDRDSACVVHVRARRGAGSPTRHTPSRAPPPAGPLTITPSAICTAVGE